MKVEELVGKQVNVNWNVETPSGGSKFAGGVPWVNLTVTGVNRFATGWFVTVNNTPVEVHRLSLSNGQPLDLEYPVEVLPFYSENEFNTLPFYTKRDLLMYRAESDGMNPTNKELYPDFSLRYLKANYQHLLPFWNEFRSQLKNVYGKEIYTLRFEVQDMFSLMVLNDVEAAKKYFNENELLKDKLKFS